MIDYQPVAQIFDAMRSETVSGMSVAEMVGGGYPMPVAVHFAQILVDHCGLTPENRILDIGCGCGRIAAALAVHLNANGHYVGVDIVPGLVDFANNFIKSKYSNFQFYTLLQSNSAYDQWKKDGSSPTISSIDAACEDSSVDLVIATSLFTHFDSAMAANMFKSIARALRPDGSALVTAFLLDSGTRRIIAKGRAAFTFTHEYGDGVFVESEQIGLGAAAFELERFLDLAQEAGLYIERILFGNWAGRQNAVSGQDIIVLRRI